MDYYDGLNLDGDVDYDERQEALAELAYREASRGDDWPEPEYEVEEDYPVFE